uniref:Uncharacterized protein n=1 Tax=Romanomermis culicivorax TaxID=13658 RepID=A0A915JAG4_ROMCU
MLEIDLLYPDDSLEVEVVPNSDLDEEVELSTMLNFPQKIKLIVNAIVLPDAGEDLIIGTDFLAHPDVGVIIDFRRNAMTIQGIEKAIDLVLVPSVTTVQRVVEEAPRIIQRIFSDIIFGDSARDSHNAKTTKPRNRLLIQKAVKKRLLLMLFPQGYH